MKHTKQHLVKRNQKNPILLELEKKFETKSLTYEKDFKRDFSLHTTTRQTVRIYVYMYIAAWKLVKTSRSGSELVAEVSCSS